MKVLIAVASRHGSTHEIAEVIAQELRASNQIVELRNAGDVDNAASYDAVILGSAVYFGNWLAEARAFAELNQTTLARVPVWLFSSGPLGPEPTPSTGNPNGLGELIKELGARGHRTFIGKLDKGSLGLGERLVSKMVKAPEGDFRDWEAIRAWARDIALALPADAAVSGKTQS